MAGATVTVANNGPVRISGDFVIKDAQGREFDVSGRESVSFCRCGGSNNKPFCDGTHNRVGFQSECEARKLPPPPPPASR
jgi:CDGSH-type Zn-finger protein